jgi:hypothetical protein
MSDSPFSLKGEQSMAIMTVTLKNSLKLENGKIIPGGKIFRGELNELPEWLQLELKMNSRVLEVERLRIPDVKKASVTELKKDTLITETQKSTPAEIVKESAVSEPEPVAQEPEKELEKPRLAKILPGKDKKKKSSPRKRVLKKVTKKEK